MSGLVRQTVGVEFIRTRHLGRDTGGHVVETYLKGCGLCGALVDNTSLHLAWHTSLAPLGTTYVEEQAWEPVAKPSLGEVFVRDMLPPEPPL